MTSETRKETSLRRLLLSPAVWGALTFALCSTVHTLSRPGNWYWPLIHEALSFALGFLPFLAFNVFILAPLAWVLVRRTCHIAAGIAFALGAALLAVAAAYAGEWLGHKPTILHVAFLYGAFIPSVVTALATWSAATALYKARASNSPAVNDRT